MTFRELHKADGPPFLLPNAWDVPSALALAEAGFAAVGTTSFGVAAASGHPDGGRASKDATATLVRQLAPLSFHVSADIEDGYDDRPESVAAYVGALGADGINIEDSSAERLVDPRRHAAKIAAIKRGSPGVFVNARVDTYWLGQSATVAETLMRARAYAEAGADGVFVPGATDPAAIRALASALELPLNVLVVPGLSLAELGELGVRRVSTGSLPYRAALDAAVAVASGVRDGRPVPPATAYPVMQERLVRYRDALDRGLSPGDGGDAGGPGRPGDADDSR